MSGQLIGRGYMTIVGLRDGDPASTYVLLPSVESVTKKLDGTLSVGEVYCSVYKVTGSAAYALSADHTLRYVRKPDGATDILEHANGVSGSITVLSDTESIEFELSDSTNVIDRVRIPILSDATDVNDELDLYRYLREAIANGDTQFKGGLMLSSLIRLGEWANADTDNPTMAKVWSGMNGLYKNGRTIANWWGGDMVDLFDENDNLIVPAPANAAAGLVRMDGSYYYSNGNIGGRADGSIWVGGQDGLKIDKNGHITLGSGIHIGTGDGTDPTTLASILNFINNLTKLIVPVNEQKEELSWAHPDVADCYALKAKKGLYAMGFLSAHGLNADGGGGGAAYDRLDKWGVYDEDKSGWVLSALLGHDLHTRLTAIEGDYVKLSELPSLSGYATEQWVLGKGYITQDALTPYLKESEADGKYLTALGVSGNYLTWTKDGVANNLTVPFATDADTLDGKHADSFVDRLTFAGSNNLEILKENYTAIANSQGRSIQLCHGSLSMAFGYLLNRPITDAYGGWFIADYTTPRWIGVAGGGWIERTFAFTSDVNSAAATASAALASHTGNTTVHITATERAAWNKAASDLSTILGSDSDTVINKWEEVVAFLDTYTEADTLAGLLGNKVDKVAGYGLSKNDFNDTLLAKLNGIEAGANRYVLPTASATVKGGAKIGSGLMMASEVLSVNLNASHIPALDWSKIATGKPTTLAGYGITDAYTRAESNGQFAPAVAYNYADGCLVRLKAPANASTMTTVLIEGQGYWKTAPIKTTIKFYNYPPDNAIIAYTGTHFGYDFGTIKVFNYDGQIYLWFIQDSNFYTYAVTAITAATGGSIGNAVESITNAPMPTDGVTRLVTIYPSKGLRTDNYASLLDSRYLQSSTASNTYVKKSGDTISGQLSLSSGFDAKLVLDNTDKDDKYQLISFRQNGVEYGRLGTEFSADLLWNKAKILTAANTYALTFAAGAFSAKTYDPKSAAVTVNIPTTTDHIAEGGNLYFTNARAVSALSSTTNALQSAINTKLSEATFNAFKTAFDGMFELVNIGTDAAPRYAIHAKYGLYSDSFLSAHGRNDAGGSGGSSYSRLDAWSAYDSTKEGYVLSAKLGYDLYQNKADSAALNSLASRVGTLEGKNYLDALTLNQSGSGNAVTAVGLSADKKTLSVTKGATFLTQHQDISGLLSKTEAASLYQPKGNYLTQHQSLANYYTKPEIDNKVVSRKEAWCHITSIYDLRYNFGSYDRNDFPTGQYYSEYPSPYGMYISLAGSDKNAAALIFIDSAAATPAADAGHVFINTRKAGDNHTTYDGWKKVAYVTDTVDNALKLGGVAASNYAKLTDIPSLAGYATESWVLGKNYLTAITKAMVENVLTGNITSHTHSQYLTQHQSLDYINIMDLREEERLPSYYTPKRLTAWFNLHGGPVADWCSGINVKGWYNNYVSWELAAAASGQVVGDSNLYFRNGINDTWEPWQKVLTSKNYASVLDSRYYTESEINTKLTDGSVSKLGTATVGAHNRAMWLNEGTPTAMTSTIGASNMPVYLQGGVFTPISSFPEAYLTWGGRATSGGVSPVDAAALNNLSANRLAFAHTSGITIEYSRDGGLTWSDYGATDGIKTALVSGIGTQLYIGGSSQGVTADCRLRVTLGASAMGIYTYACKVLMNISTNGCNGCRVLVEYSLNGSPAAFSVSGDYGINGWSAWNSVPFITAFGGSTASITHSLRLTFYCSSVSSNAAALSLIDLTLIGVTYWITPSPMAKTGHLYDYDVDKNAVFPAAVKATSFIKQGGTASQFLKADGSVDSNSYALASALGNYLPLVGGTMANTNLVTNLNADLLDGKHNGQLSAVDAQYLKILGGIFPSEYPTVKAGKDRLVEIFAAQGAGIGYPVEIGSDYISKWVSESATVNNSSTHTLIKIGGHYSGAANGQWLLSLYGANRLGVVGRANNAWTDISYLAFLTDNVASATKLADNATYTAWGRPFFANGKPQNVSGNMTGVGEIYMSGALWFKRNNSAKGAYFSFDDGGNIGLYFHENYGYKLCTAYFAYNGNVGFGTVNPAYKVDIVGTARISEGLLIGGLLSANGGISTTAITATEIHLGPITLKYDATNKGLQVIGGGLHTDSYLSAHGPSPTTVDYEARIAALESKIAQLENQLSA